MLAAELLRQGQMKQTHSDEENDVPFTRRELGDSTGTMDKPLDTSDAPGKADSEAGEEGLPPR